MLTSSDPKDPDDTDDYTLDWANVLATGETLSTLSVTGAGVTVASSSISGTTTIARLTAGTAQTDATVRYRVTTSAGRQLDETLIVKVEER